MWQTKLPAWTKPPDQFSNLSRWGLSFKKQKVLTSEQIPLSKVLQQCKLSLKNSPDGPPSSHRLLLQMSILRFFANACELWRCIEFEIGVKKQRIHTVFTRVQEAPKFQTHPIFFLLFVCKVPLTQWVKTHPSSRRTPTPSVWRSVK